MTTPETRIASLTGRLFDENARGSSGVVAVLALELDEAADRQPVERVERLALRAQDLGARREADAELEDADAGEARGDEVTELVDHHEGAQDQEEQDDRDDRLEDAHQAAPPTGPVAYVGADVGVERDQLVDVRVAAAPTPKRSTAASSRRGMPEEVERARQESLDRDVVGGDQRGRRPRPGDAGLAGDPQAPESAPRSGAGSRAGPWRPGRAAAAGEGWRSG